MWHETVVIDALCCAFVTVCVWEVVGAYIRGGGATQPIICDPADQGEDPEDQGQGGYGVQELWGDGGGGHRHLGWQSHLDQHQARVSFRFITSEATVVKNYLPFNV